MFSRNLNHHGTLRRTRGEPGRCLQGCRPDDPAVDAALAAEQAARVQAHADRVQAQRPDALGYLGINSEVRRDVIRAGRERAAAECLQILGPLCHAHLAEAVGVCTTTLYAVLRGPWFVRHGNRWHLTLAGREALAAQEGRT
jgi:hypothetical protein